MGKTRLALSPRENHWWHVTLNVTARGLATPPIAHGTTLFDVEFDFVDHRLVIRTSDGGRRTMSLASRSVADFYREYLASLGDLGLTVRFRAVPDEIEDPIPFGDDRQHATYDADQVNRFWRVLVQADRILRRFRGRFVRQTAERINFLRDVHLGLLPRLRIPETVAFLEELRGLFLLDPPPRGA